MTRRSGRVLAILLAATGLLSGAEARAAAGTQGLVRIPGDKHIKGLVWSALPPKREITRDKLGHTQRSAVVSVQFARSGGWTLIFQTQDQAKPQVLGTSGAFDLKVPLQWRRTRFMLTAVGPAGSVETEYSEIEDPALPAREVPQKVSSWNLGVGLGYSFISYNDSRIPHLSEGGLTLKASINYWISRDNRWSVGVSGYYTVLPIAASLDTPIRFLGLNGRLGYRIPFGKSAWSLSIQTGVYYTTTFVSVDDPSKAFGFQSMMGPQLFPILNRAFANGMNLAAYVKVSPVSTGGAAITFGNRELATGINASMKLTNGHSVGVTLDAASFNLTIQDVEMSSSSLSLGLGYTL